MARRHQNLEAGGDEKLKINFMWPNKADTGLHSPHVSWIDVSCETAVYLSVSVDGCGFTLIDF